MAICNTFLFFDQFANFSLHFACNQSLFFVHRFGGQGYVNGEPMESDAHSVSDYIGLSYLFWAALFFAFSILAAILGLLSPLDGVAYKEEEKRQQEFQTSSVHYDQTTQYQYAAEDGNIPVATKVQVW